MSQQSVVLCWDLLAADNSCSTETSRMFQKYSFFFSFRARREAELTGQGAPALEAALKAGEDCSVSETLERELLEARLDKDR